MVLGEDGIIAQAKLAAEKTKEAEEQAKGDLANLTEEISNILTSEPPTSTPKPTPPTLAEAKQKETTFKKTTEVKVGDNDTMTVPGGFRIKEGNSIAEGIVITDSADENGNEFVWVPVAINDMVWCKDHAGSIITFDKTTNKFTCTPKKETNAQAHEPSNTQLVGKLYATTTGENFTAGTPNTTFSSSVFREPDTLSDSSNDTPEQLASAGFTTDLNNSGKVDKEDFKIELQKKFYEMAKSVAKYGGFYVGRYETSLSASNISESKAGAKSLYNDSNHNWYVQYKCNKEYAERNKNLKVVSSTIWGCQYDAMMNWMLSNDINVTSTTPTADVEMNTDSTNRKTGSNSKDKLCNIYDLLGNSYEWTMEANGDNKRVSRGGYHGSGIPPSVRSNGFPTNALGSISARLSLYVNL